MNLPKEISTITPLSRYLSLFVIIALPFIGFYVGFRYAERFAEYIQSRASVDQYLLKTQPAATQSASTENPDSIGEGWKVYSLQSDFEIKYPQSWNFYKFQENDIAFGPKELIQANRERLENPNTGAMIGGKAWPVEIEPLNDTLYFYGGNSEPFISDDQRKVSSEEVIIDGIHAVRYTIVFNYEAPYISKGDTIEVVIIEKGSKTYSITLSDQRYRDIYDQILSTFQLTNP